MYSVDHIGPPRLGPTSAMASETRQRVFISAAQLEEDITQSARVIVQSEPILSALMTKSILQRTSLADTVAAIIAENLACAGVCASELHATMRFALDEHDYASMSLVADVAAVVHRDPACTGPLHVVLNMKGFHALQAYRVAHWLWQRGRKPLASWIAARSASVYSVDIHPAATIGSGVFIDHATGVVIGETAIVEDDVSILQGVTLGGTGKDTGDRHPIVRHGVMIGAGAKILGRIEIGALSKVAAGSVVLREVPANCTVAGVPARIVRFNGLKQAPAHSMDQSI